MKTPTLALALLLLAGAGSAARADWDLIIKCKGTPPVCDLPSLFAPPAPVPPAPVPPAPVPPPSAPPSPPVVAPPARDPTPFAYAGPCPNRQIAPDERTMWTWEYPGDFENFYGYVDGTGNPLPGSHTCYGIFSPTATTPPVPGLPQGKSLKDAHLWGPRKAMTQRPWDIRCVLATGRHCP